MSTVHWFRGREAPETAYNLGPTRAPRHGEQALGIRTRLDGTKHDCETQLETLGGTLGAEDNVR